ncbi:endonuclease 8-like 1 [Thalassophryne amazonica]|uniref:endonuclease 8-like 1 n=1 Tax=Thalassophryne amazonica TaxID=390379 RepID=UPI0014715FFE|nr:endonuclease 8-like 1 [Thalassophryne amazonica]
MPEGPELHLASLYVNRMCEGVVFTGPVKKSEVSKNPDVAFTCSAYCISATSRGKEVKLTLTPMKSDDPKQRVQAGQADRPMDIVFRFGMSGYFRFTTQDEIPKHSHLQFSSNEKPCRVLSFVDTRRFGSWEPNGMWQPDRGPCVMFEYKSFRENVLLHLSDRAFDKPICEVLLNQKYFNGIGNYLRAEILFRLNIAPFVRARILLDNLELEDVHENTKSVKEEEVDTKVFMKVRKKRVKGEAADLLRLCHTVPLEVVNLGGKGYDPEKVDQSKFQAWLQCYYVDGMKSVRDHNGRTVWFRGDPGPMAPTDSKSPKVKKGVKKGEDKGSAAKTKKVANKRALKEHVAKQQTVKKKLKKEKETRSKQEGFGKVNTPQDDKTVNARRRRTSNVHVAAGSQRRRERVTTQSSK